MIIKEHTNTMRDEMVIGQYHDDLNSETPTADKHIMCCLYNTHKLTMRSDTCTSAAKEYTELFLINYKFPEDWEWVKLNVHIAAYSIVHYRVVQCITGQHSALPGSTVHYRAVQCITGQYSALPGSIVHYRAVQCITGQYSALPGSTVHYRAVQCITGQHSALPGSTVHYRAVQCITGQYSALPGSTVHYRAVQCITVQYTHCLVSDATGHQAHMTQTRHHQHWEIN